MATYRHQHETTTAYDALKGTAHALQARYIALSRDALGDPGQQQAHNEQVLRVRNAVAAVDPDDRDAIEDLAERLQSELRELKGTG